MARPIIKSAQELAMMRQAGAIAAKVLREASAAVVPGTTTQQLDDLIGTVIRRHGDTSAFLGYRGFPKQSCISVNEGVIHGIANDRRLQFGDLVKLDIGVRYRGLVGDVAMSVACGGCTPLAQKLMDVAIEGM